MWFTLSFKSPHSFVFAVSIFHPLVLQLVTGTLSHITSSSTAQSQQLEQTLARLAATEHACQVKETEKEDLLASYRLLAQEHTALKRAAAELTQVLIDASLSTFITFCKFLVFVFCV